MPQIFSVRKKLIECICHSNQAVAVKRSQRASPVF
jgi:hypothetical protein